MSVETPPPVATPVKSYAPPVAQVVYSYPPPSAESQGIKPTAPPYYPQQQQYTYAQMPYQQTTWVNPTYQPQVYPPQQYVVATPPVQQQPQQGSGLAIAGGFLAGMLAADILDDITDP
jgi:hypothetical protein